MSSGFFVVAHMLTPNVNHWAAYLYQFWGYTPHPPTVRKWWILGKHWEPTTVAFKWCSRPDTNATTCPRTTHSVSWENRNGAISSPGCEGLPSHHDFTKVTNKKGSTPLGKLTWNPKMEVWKMTFLFNWVIFWFQPLIFRGVGGTRCRIFFA